MSRINTNVNSLIAQRVLGLNNKALNTSLERLSTGLRITRGKDDPAGLIASQNLRAEKSALGQAISNAERADQVVNIAEGGLDEVSSLLSELQGLVTQTANSSGLSSEEKQANQLQIDSIIQTIDRVASSTSFQGLKLLNGNLDFTTESVGSNVGSYKINSAKLDFEGTRDVDVVVTGSAQVAGFYLSFGDDRIDLTNADSRFVLEITGNRGTRELSFASGTSVSDIVSAINSFTDVTGIEATLSGSGATSSGIVLASVDFGENEFVSVRVIDDGGINSAVAQSGVYEFNAGDTTTASTASGDRTLFSNASNKITDFGQDVAATINGIVATTQGTTARINTDFLDVEIDLRTGTASSTGAEAQRLGALTAFTITGGGADFQLAGRVDIAGKVSLGIQNVQVNNLGRTKDGADTYFLADLGSGRNLNLVDGNVNQAQEVVENAIREVSGLRGRLGAFQKNTIGATIRSLGVAVENTAAAESVVRDADFASETASLTRAQILSTSASQILTLANSQPQSALQLLG
ncbi:MAG: flagellin [Planctomycetota bacterium]|nr:flagellin [Planctomycetota bacterium]